MTFHYYNKVELWYCPGDEPGFFLYLRHPVFALVLCQDPAPGELHIHAPSADLLLSLALVHGAFPDQGFAGTTTLEVTSLRRGDSVVLNQRRGGFRFSPQSEVCLHAVVEAFLEYRRAVDQLTVDVVDVVAGPANLFGIVEIGVAADLGVCPVPGLPDVIRAAGSHSCFHGFPETVHGQTETSPNMIGINVGGGQAS